MDERELIGHEIYDKDKDERLLEVRKQSMKKFREFLDLDESITDEEVLKKVDKLLKENKGVIEDDE